MLSLMHILCRTAIHRAGAGVLRRHPPQPVEQLPVVRHRRAARSDLHRRRRRQVRRHLRAVLVGVRHRVHHLRLHRVVRGVARDARRQVSRRHFGRRRILRRLCARKIQRENFTLLFVGNLCESESE